MFVYEDGLPVDYIPTGSPSPEIDEAVRAHMLAWYRSLPGQARVRLGKVGIMEGSTPNLNRLEHE